MTAPSQAWEHLQSVLIYIYNRIIREEFSDLNDTKDDFNFNTPRQSLQSLALKIAIQNLENNQDNSETQSKTNSRSPNIDFSDLIKPIDNQT